MLCAICALVCLTVSEAFAVESLEAPQEAVLSEADLHELLTQELRAWIPAEGERIEAARKVEQWIASWLEALPAEVDLKALASGLRDQATVLGSQSIAPDENPLLGLALLLAAGLALDVSQQEARELRQQMQTLSAEAERHLYDRMRGPDLGNLPLTQGELRAFLEGRFESQVVPYLRDPLWPMLKYPFSGDEYRHIRQALLSSVYQTQFDQTDSREDVLEEAAWVIRRLPGLAAQVRLAEAKGLAVQLDRGPARLVCTVGETDAAGYSRRFFLSVLRSFGFPNRLTREAPHADESPE